MHVFYVFTQATIRGHILRYFTMSQITVIFVILAIVDCYNDTEIILDIFKNGGKTDYSFINIHIIKMSIESLFNKKTKSNHDEIVYSFPRRQPFMKKKNSRFLLSLPTPFRETNQEKSYEEEYSFIGF